MKTPPSARLPVSLAVALALHAFALLGLVPLAQWIGSLQSPPPAAAASISPPGEVIPIKLPATNRLELVTELGSIARSTSGQSAETLPSAKTGIAVAMSLSDSLAAAAREAQLAYERLHPPRQTLRFVADLRLIETAVAGIEPEPSAARAARNEVSAKAAQATTEGASRAQGAPSSSSAQTTPKRSAPERPSAQKPAARPPDSAAARADPPKPSKPPAEAQAAPPKPIAEAPKPTPLPAPMPAETMPRPMIYAPEPHFDPVETYRGPLPDVIAEAPAVSGSSVPPSNSLSAGGPVLGPGAAPERGAGQAVANRAQFFQRLTNHLFQVNQSVLAEAIRATPRLTVDVQFSIDRNGRVLDARVQRSTGSPTLDDKAIEVIRRASPVPQLPADMPQQRLELSFPVQIYR